MEPKPRRLEAVNNVVFRLIDDSLDTIRDYLLSVDSDLTKLEALSNLPVVSLTYEAVYHAVVSLNSMKEDLRRDVMRVRDRFAALGATSSVLGSNLEFDANGTRANGEYSFFNTGPDADNASLIVWGSDLRADLNELQSNTAAFLRRDLNQYFVIRDERDGDDTRALCVNFRPVLLA